MWIALFSTFTGSQADAYRRTLAVVPKDRIAHYFEGYLIDRLGEIEELEPLQVSDDREKNVLNKDVFTIIEINVSIKLFFAP